MTVRRYLISVCDSCMSMLGSECHTPGCSFWMHDTPTPDVVAVLAEVRFSHGDRFDRLLP